jgi:restriction system protein
MSQTKENMKTRSGVTASSITITCSNCGCKNIIPPEKKHKVLNCGNSGCLHPLPPQPVEVPEWLSVTGLIKYVLRYHQWPNYDEYFTKKETYEKSLNRYLVQCKEWDDVSTAPRIKSPSPDGSISLHSNVMPDKSISGELQITSPERQQIYTEVIITSRVCYQDTSQLNSTNYHQESQVNSSTKYPQMQSAPTSQSATSQYTITNHHQESHTNSRTQISQIQRKPTPQPAIPQHAITETNKEFHKITNNINPQIQNVSTSDPATSKPKSSINTPVNSYSIYTGNITTEVEREQIDYWISLHALTIDKVDKLSGIQFEEYIVFLYTILGYTCWLTTESNDFGADIIIQGSDRKKIAIQAKRYNKQVGISAVQELMSGMKYYSCSSGVIITNSELSRSANELLSKTRSITVISRKELLEMISTHIIKRQHNYTIEDFNKFRDNKKIYQISKRKKPVRSKDTYNNTTSTKGVKS